MRYMGIDWGTKKVGIAYSDESGTIAFPDAVIAKKEANASAIQERCRANAVGHVILGIPRTTGARENPIVADIREMHDKLKQTLDIPVTLFFEEHTSAHVRQLSDTVSGKKHTKQIDAQAAALILQRYLDSHK